MTPEILRALAGFGRHQHARYTPPIYNPPADYDPTEDLMQASSLEQQALGLPLQQPRAPRLEQAIIPLILAALAGDQGGNVLQGAFGGFMQGRGMQQDRLNQERAQKQQGILAQAGRQREVAGLRERANKMAIDRYHRQYSQDVKRVEDTRQFDVQQQNRLGLADEKNKSLEKQKKIIAAMSNLKSDIPEVRVSARELLKGVLFDPELNSAQHQAVFDALKTIGEPTPGQKSIEAGTALKEARTATEKAMLNPKVRLTLSRAGVNEATEEKIRQEVDLFPEYHKARVAELYARREGVLGRLSVARSAEERRRLSSELKASQSAEDKIIDDSIRKHERTLIDQLVEINRVKDSPGTSILGGTDKAMRLAELESQADQLRKTIAFLRSKKTTEGTAPMRISSANGVAPKGVGSAAPPSKRQIR